MIGELVSRVILDTRSIKKTEYTCEASRRADQGESRMDREGSHSPEWVPGYIFERGGRIVHASLKIRSNV